MSNRSKTFALIHRLSHLTGEAGSSPGVLVSRRRPW